MKSRLLFTIPLALLCLASYGRGQTVSGTLQGHVTDQTAAVVAGTTIAAKNLETGLERKTVTDEKGFTK